MHWLGGHDQPHRFVKWLQENFLAYSKAGVSNRSNGQPRWVLYPFLTFTSERRCYNYEQHLFITILRCARSMRPGRTTPYILSRLSEILFSTYDTSHLFPSAFPPPARGLRETSSQRIIFSGDVQGLFCARAFDMLNQAVLPLVLLWDMPQCTVVQDIGPQLPQIRINTMCVCVFFTFILDIKFVGRTRRGHTGGRSHGISHPPSFCGACLNFSREKDSAIPFPRRP